MHESLGYCCFLNDYPFLTIGIWFAFIAGIAFITGVAITTIVTAI